MRTISFSILGNHKDPKGNAVPKLKMTGRQHWTPKAKEYVLWKQHVVSSFISSLPQGTQNLIEKDFYPGKPIRLEKEEHALMRLRIKWKDNTHGDPENIFGSVADALFENDKNLDIGTVSVRAKEGRIGVTIYIFDDEEEKVLFMENNASI